jgi:hypothetical protein
LSSRATNTDRFRRRALAAYSGTVATKIGRNDPCPCGSGLKYKRCCEERDRRRAADARRRGIRRLSPSEERNPAIIALRREVEVRQDRALTRLREDFGVHINFVAPVEFEGGKVWALGDRVYLTRPRNETFHEFLLSILREMLGERWRAEQAAQEDKHFLMRCFEEYEAWTRRGRKRIESTDAGDQRPPAAAPSTISTPTGRAGSCRRGLPRIGGSASRTPPDSRDRSGSRVVRGHPSGRGCHGV